MTLIVGTDSFVTLAAADAYWLARGNTDWSDVTDDVTREVYLRKASDWIQRTFIFMGVPAMGARLHFPAIDVYDTFGRKITDVPTEVQEATSVVADIVRDGTYNLDGIITRDTAVKKEKVDVIEVEYDTTSLPLSGDVLTHVYQMLSPYTRQNSLLRS